MQRFSIRLNPEAQLWQVGSATVLLQLIAANSLSAAANLKLNVFRKSTGVLRHGITKCIDHNEKEF